MACRTCQKRKQEQAAQKVEALSAQARKAKSLTLEQDSAPDLYASSKSIPNIGVREPVIMNWQYRPPAGGWAVTLRVSGQRRQFSGTPTKIVADIVTAYRAVGRPVQEIKVWDYLNMVWSDRDPTRLRRVTKKQVETAQKDPNAHLQVSPSTYGPRVWGMLSLFGVKGQFDKDAWMSVIRYVTKLLDPAESPGGCDDCHETWTKWRIEHNPEEVEDEHAAARWVFNLHNEVNRKIDKRRISFVDAVQANQWAFEIRDDQAIPI